MTTLVVLVLLPARREQGLVRPLRGRRRGRLRAGGLEARAGRTIYAIRRHLSSGWYGFGAVGALIAAPGRTLELQNVFFSSTFRAKATSSRPRKSPELFRWEISQSKNIVYPERLDQLYLFYSRFLLWFARLNSYLDGRWPRGPKVCSCESSRRPRPRSIATRAPPQRERRASKLYRSAGIRGRGRDP